MYSLASSLFFISFVSFKRNFHITWHIDCWALKDLFGAASPTNGTSGSRFYLEEPERPLGCLEGSAQSVKCRKSIRNKGNFLALIFHLADSWREACLGLSL